MATTGFSSANYHSVADHADFTLPDGDWFELIIFRPDDIASTQVILSSGEPYSANTRHLIQFDNSLELVVDGADGTLITGLSSGTWYLVCLQRSSGNMQVRMVPMGTTSVSSGGIVALTGAQNSTSEQRVGRSGGATASPLDGAVSDWLFVPGETISNADLQAIATGTAIDSFAWYSSATFWAILENSTNTDHIGGKTITENGTLTSATDPGDLVRFGGTTVAIGLVTESDTAQSFSLGGDNLAAQYSSGNYHSIPDAAGMTLPDNDWTWLYTVKTGSDVTTGQDISANGVYQAANVFNLYISGGVFGVDISNLGTDETVSCSTDTWYLVAVTRESGTFTVRAIPFGSSIVSESSGTVISSAYDSSTGYHFGVGSDLNFPLVGGAAIGDALFLPGEAVSDADLISIADTNTPLSNFSWYSNREFHLIASLDADDTGNHTVTETGTTAIVLGPPGFIREGDKTALIGLVTETGIAQNVTGLKAVSVGLVSESGLSRSITPVKPVSAGLVTENDIAQNATSIKPILQSIGLVTETDIPQSTGAGKLASLNLANESDLAQILITATGIPVDQVIETDSAHAVKPERTLTGQVSEINHVQPFGHIIYQVVGFADEVNFAKTLSAGTGVDIGIVTETGQPQSFVPVKPIVLPIGLIAESDQALAVAFNRPIGLVAEIDAALGFTLSEFVTILPTNAASNIYFIVNNKIDDANTLAATSTAAGFDVDNLKLEQKLKVWRSVDLSVQTITLTWTEPENISAVGIAFSNLTRGAIVRNKLYTNVADSSPVFDTGNESVDYSYGPPKGFSTIGLSSFAFGGGTYFSSLFDTVQAKKLEINISNATNPDGYIEISRLVVGKAFTPAVGASYGAAVGHDDASSSLRTDAGELVSSRGAMNKKLPFTLGMMSPNDRREFFEMLRRNGKTSPIFLSLYENAITPEERQSHIIYGVIDELPSVPIQNFNIYNSTIQITEI